jgi:hypothetical protein
MVHWWALVGPLEWMRSCNSCKLLKLLVQYFNLETILQGAPSWLLIPVSVFTCIELVTLAAGFPLVSWLWITFPGWKSKFNSVVLEIHPRVSQGPDHFGRLHLKWFKSSTTLGPMKFPCIFQACDWTCVMFFDLKCTTFSLMIIDFSSWQWFQTPEYLASHLWKLINLI